MAITPEQARTELARRELARRELARRGQNEPPVTGIPGKKSVPLSERALSFAIGGLAPAVGGATHAEEALPVLGQTIGGGLRGYPGSVAGAVLGQTGRQMVKAGRGQGFDPMSIGREAITTGITEGVFMGAGKVLKKPIEGIANRLALSVMKPARDVIKRNPKLGLEAIESGITGTKESMLSKAEKLIKQGEGQLQPLLKARPQKVNILNVAADLDELKKPFANVGDQGAIDAIEEVQNMLLNKSQTGLIGLEEANQLKRDLYKVLKSSQYGKGPGEIPVKASARKGVAYGIKKEIESAIPEAKAINKRQAIGIEAREALENRLAQEQKNVILPKLAAMGAGYTSFTGNIPGALGVLAGEAAINYLRSAPFATGLARNVLKARRFGRPLTIGAAEAARRFGQS